MPKPYSERPKGPGYPHSRHRVERPQTATPQQSAVPGPSRPVTPVAPSRLSQAKLNWSRSIVDQVHDPRGASLGLSQPLPVRSMAAARARAGEHLVASAVVEEAPVVVPEPIPVAPVLAAPMPYLPELPPPPPSLWERVRAKTAEWLGRTPQP